MAGLLPPWTDVILAGGVMLGTLFVGTLAHESAHVAVLRAFEIPYDVDWRPPDTASDSVVARPLATVTPRLETSTASSVGLRLAAVAPLGLTAPLLLVLTGVFPDPLATDDPSLVAATVAWTGCALPSPQDFGVFWHGDRSAGGPLPDGGDASSRRLTAGGAPDRTDHPAD